MTNERSDKMFKCGSVHIIHNLPKHPCGGAGDESLHCEEPF
jgi:hypothetical protein